MSQSSVVFYTQLEASLETLLRKLLLALLLLALVYFFQRLLGKAQLTHSDNL